MGLAGTAAYAAVLFGAPLLIEGLLVGAPALWGARLSPSGVGAAGVIVSEHFGAAVGAYISGDVFVGGTFATVGVPCECIPAISTVEDAQVEKLDEMTWKLKVSSCVAVNAETWRLEDEYQMLS